MMMGKSIVTTRLNLSRACPDRFDFHESESVRQYFEAEVHVLYLYVVVIFILTRPIGP